jgi:hypothetical protein
MDEGIRDRSGDVNGEQPAAKRPKGAKAQAMRLIASGLAASAAPTGTARVVCFFAILIIQHINSKRVEGVMLTIAEALRSLSLQATHAMWLCGYFVSPLLAACRAFPRSTRR